MTVSGDGKSHDDSIAATVDRRARILEMIDIEFGRAINKFGSFNSGHEGKAVIEEELDELWEEVRRDRPGGAAATREAIQIAAMAMRFVFDLSEWPDYVEQER